MNVSSAELSVAQFHAVSTLVRRICGIHLHRGKYELVRARLASRIREVRLVDFDSYLEMVARDTTGRELAKLVDSLTTNKTSFFREPKHFELLRQRVLPELYRAPRPLRVWSAGCSSGEEPYSLAMTVYDELGDGARVRILATDISARMLARARQATYPEDALAEVPSGMRQLHFRCVSAAPPRSYVVSERLRGMVRFAQLNLMSSWPMRDPFQLICCRNVMIYFDKQTQQKLVERFWSMLEPGGYFFGGHAESFAALEHSFEYVQPAVYRRPA